MKKLITCFVACLLTVTAANAQNYRKWDFTHWSASTVDNLKTEATKGVTGGSWSDVEKATATAPTDISKDNCFWLYDGTMTTLTANGQEIAETAGLEFNPSYAGNRSLAIAVYYPETSIGTYAGPSYLWLGASKKTCFTIPKVRIGQKMTFVVESHKPAEARGIELYVGSVSETNKIGDSFTPTTQESHTWENWTLPEGATTNDDGSVDIVVYNTNGCHIYSIEVGDDTQKSKIAYLYQGAPDEIQNYAAAMPNYEVESIDVSTTAKTVEELAAYDAVVVAPTVTDANWAAVLKSVLGWTPIVNTSFGLYELWGLGNAVNTNEWTLRISNPNHQLLNGIEIITDETEGISGIELSSDVYAINDLGAYFANDDIVGTDIQGNGLPTIHVHGISHNAYIFVPSGNGQLIANAIKAAANSKAAIIAAPMPNIRFEYGNMTTKVTINSSVPGAKIYYSTDGSEPTTDNLYTEPFWMNTEATIKAKVEGEGYTMSETAEAQVELKHQAPKPTIDVQQHKGYATVTLACESEDANIFYNYSETNDSLKSTKYAGPITLMKGRTITAFAASQSLVPSDMATQSVNVDTPMAFTDILAHMDAAKDPYYTKEYDEAKTNSDSNSKVAYYFSWGKSKTAYPFYDITAEPIGYDTDPETGDETPIYPKNPEEKFDFGNGWAVRSRGQIICNEITIKPGNDIGNGSSYNPATVDEYEFSEEYPVTDFYLNISEWNTSNDPRSGIIYTTQKVKGPFAILSYISNGNSGTGPSVVFETGDDIDGDAVDTKWDIVGDTCVLNQGQRLYRKFVRLYTGTDEVYIRTRIANGGSKAGFYDIYVLGVDPAFVTGISDLQHDAQAADRKLDGIYSPDGVQRKSLHRGLNIVVRNGEAQKVMVKY